MSGANTATATCAKLNTAIPCSNRRRALRLNEAVMQKSRDLFPVKTAHHLSDITGYSLRTVEYWLSGKVVLPADALAALMQSEWGREFLTGIMSENTWRWWLQLKAWWSSIDIAAAQIKHRRRLRELLDEDARYSQVSAAEMFQDQPFYEGQPAPVRALAKRRMK